MHLLNTVNIYGKHLTGKKIRSLSRWLFAIETCLGLILKVKTRKFKTANSINVVLFFYVVETQIFDLWRLDTLGILDSGQKATGEELITAAEEHLI